MELSNWPRFQATEKNAVPELSSNVIVMVTFSASTSTTP
jgi:hypothetical protein